MDKKHLLMGGLVAAGFDSSGSFLLTVSHSGRGVFLAGTWERVARDAEVIYPQRSSIDGIGPITGVAIHVAELNEQTPQATLHSPDGRFHLLIESDGITISDAHGKI